MHQVSFRFLALAGLGLALAACGHDDPQRSSPVTTVSHREAAFAKVLPDCPVSDEGAQGQRLAPAVVPIVAALAPVAIDFAVSAVRDYLQRVESEHTGNFLATGAGPLPENGTACLVVGRGVLGKPSASLSKQGSLEDTHMTRVGLAQPPAFYMEVRIKTTVQLPETAPPAKGVGKEGQPRASKPQSEPKKEGQPRTVMEFTPQLIHYAQTVAKRGKDEEKSVAAVVVLRSTAAPEEPTSATAAKDAEAAFPLNLGKLVPGTEVRPADFAQVDGHPLADLWRTTTFSGKFSNPNLVNLYAFVTESDDPNKVVALLSKTLERQSDGLQKALNKAVEDAMKPAK